MPARRSASPPSWQRPEAYHEQKSEIVAALRALARGSLLVRQVVRFLVRQVPGQAVLGFNETAP